MAEQPDNNQPSDEQIAILDNPDVQNAVQTIETALAGITVMGMAAFDEPADKLFTTTTHRNIQQLQAQLTTVMNIQNQPYTPGGLGNDIRQKLSEGMGTTADSIFGGPGSADRFLDAMDELHRQGVLTPEMAAAGDKLAQERFGYEPPDPNEDWDPNRTQNDVIMHLVGFVSENFPAAMPMLAQLFKAFTGKDLTELMSPEQAAAHNLNPAQDITADTMADNFAVIMENNPDVDTVDQLMNRMRSAITLMPLGGDGNREAFETGIDKALEEARQHLDGQDLSDIGVRNRAAEAFGRAFIENMQDGPGPAFEEKPPTGPHPALHGMQFQATGPITARHIAEAYNANVDLRHRPLFFTDASGQTFVAGMDEESGIFDIREFDHEAMRLFMTDFITAQGEDYNPRDLKDALCENFPAYDLATNHSQYIYFNDSGLNHETLSFTKNSHPIHLAENAVNIGHILNNFDIEWSGSEFFQRHDDPGASSQTPQSGRMPPPGAYQPRPELADNGAHVNGPFAPGDARRADTNAGRTLQQDWLNAQRRADDLHQEQARPTMTVEPYMKSYGNGVPILHRDGLVDEISIELEYIDRGDGLHKKIDVTGEMRDFLSGGYNVYDLNGLAHRFPKLTEIANQYEDMSTALDVAHNIEHRIERKHGEGALRSDHTGRDIHHPHNQTPQQDNNNGGDIRRAIPGLGGFLDNFTNPIDVLRRYSNMRVGFNDVSGFSQTPTAQFAMAAEPSAGNQFADNALNIGEPMRIDDYRQDLDADTDIERKHSNPSMVA